MTPITILENPHLVGDELNDLFAASWPSHRTREFVPVLARSLVYVAARRDGQLIGFANAVWDGGSHAFLLDPTVRPEHRRQGVGTALLRRVATCARGRGASWLHVDFVPALEPFYAAAGFRPTAAGLLDLHAEEEVLPVPPRATAETSPSFLTPLAHLQPSQLYVSSVKLARVLGDWKGKRIEDIAPLPVKKLDDRVVLTDGHTRAVAAHLFGYHELRTVWDDDDLDWDAYGICVRWCLEEGVRSVGQLVTRVVDPASYERLWVDRCQRMHEGLASPSSARGDLGINEGAAARALSRWQDILRLRDWDIEIQIVRETWRKSGDIKIDASNKLAVLLLNHTIADDVEETVLHELVHLRLHALDRMIEDLLRATYGSEEEDPKRQLGYAAFMDRLESTTQDLTKALLTANDRKPEAVSRFLREAVARELEEGR